MRKTKSNIGAFAFAAIAGAFMIALALLLLPIIFAIVVVLGLGVAVVAIPLAIAFASSMILLAPIWGALGLIVGAIGLPIGGWCGGALLLAISFALSWLLVYVLYEYALTKALKQKRSVFTLWICAVLVWVIPGVFMAQFAGTNAINAQLNNPLVSLMFGQHSVSFGADMTLWASIALAFVLYPIVFVVNALSKMLGFDFVG